MRGRQFSGERVQFLHQILQVHASHKGEKKSLHQGDKGGRGWGKSQVQHYRNAQARGERKTDINNSNARQTLISVEGRYGKMP